MVTQTQLDELAEQVEHYHRIVYDHIQRLDDRIDRLRELLNDLDADLHAKDQ